MKSLTRDWVAELSRRSTEGRSAWLAVEDEDIPVMVWVARCCWASDAAAACGVLVPSSSSWPSSGSSSYSSSSFDPSDSKESSWPISTVTGSPSSSTNVPSSASK
ncbi:hypothetical protein EJ03DRAFT_139656 [Teratosphaeria nubilosa]|uniref:Uncharacterized protein n=1 Tax=Teratosphaeria nubilosa TaxID=161662 RepID=A0A6G1L4S0_9PEZI|nr:hypothetical protein EJ03DRAFT_139656 [Teratosphaeria nubilosa]